MSGIKLQMILWKMKDWQIGLPGGNIKIKLGGPLRQAQAVFPRLNELNKE